MTEDEMDRLATKIADAITAKGGNATHATINPSGHYTGSKEDLAKTVTTAMREAVRKGRLPKSLLGGL